MTYRHLIVAEESSSLPSAALPSPVEVSVVIPCLNEAETLGTCVNKALAAFEKAGVAAEVIVSDNGSTDGSGELASRLGARVVEAASKGYGHALRAGIAAARGRYVIMGDADDSYDFLEAPKFLQPLREGYVLAQGCRLPSGGGTVRPGAMPWLHRWIGNPLFTLLARQWFSAPIHDVYCGMRGFSKSHYLSLNQRCTGMEFAIEMVVKSALKGARIAEVPITLHPDGRKAHAPHLRSFRDGWRTLRFLLLISPRWLFLVPGATLIALGLASAAAALAGLSIGRVTFDAHTLLFGSLFLMCGYQAVLFSILSKTFAIREGILPEDTAYKRFYAVANLERGILISAISFLIGVCLLLVALDQWRGVNFGALDYSRTMRWVIPGATLTVLGFQTLLFSFLDSVLGMERL